MKRRILDLTAAAIVFELFLELGTFVYCQAPDGDKGETRHFGSSLAETKTKSKKKSKEEGSRLKNWSRAPSTDNDGDILRVDTSLVVNEILVQDKKGSVIKELKRNDFVVDEDSVPQNIEVFALGGDSSIPRSVILVIDYSFSELPYITTSVEAAKVLVDKLHPYDQMALVTDDIELLSGFTSDKDLLKTKLDSLKTKALAGNVGKSKQYSALLAALQELFPARAVRPVVLFQTDGDQLAEFAGYGYGNETTGSGRREQSAPFKRLLSALEETGATVYTIVPGPCFTVDSKKERLQNATAALLGRAVRNDADSDKDVKLSSTYVASYANIRQRDETALVQLSRKSGGYVEHLEKPEDADAVYSRILSQMNSRYVIGYYPTNQERNGMRRRIEIRLRTNSNYIIWGRKTYIAPDDGQR